MLMLVGTGRISSDIVSSITESGKKVIRFSVAFRIPYSETATFLNCEAWGGKAEFLEKHFFKGKPVTLRATPLNNNYTDKKGVKRYEMIYRVDDVEFVPNEKRTGNEKTESEQHLDFENDIYGTDIMYDSDGVLF